jgi:hypothetical protein
MESSLIDLLPGVTGVPDVAASLGLSFVLLLFVTWVYRHTHRGPTYSQSHAQTLVILGMVVALIMMIIGSSLARAFSLVGALSIIRFRNAVKETRDVGFVFVVVAVCMACGTRLYLLALFATVALTMAIVLMHEMDFFGKRLSARLLRVRLAAELDPEIAFEPIFRAYLAESRLLSIESVNGGNQQELTYSVVLSSEREPRQFVEALRAVNDHQKVALILGAQETTSG